MFRSKRNALTKRLWKLRESTSINGRHSARADGAQATADILGPEELEVKTVAQSMLKRLKETQLELLLQAIESRGADDTGCVLVPQGDLRLGRRTAAPHVLCSQLWRWPEVRHDYELKRLPWCQSATDPLYICCNPYHWSRIYKPDSPPPPYSRLPQDILHEDEQTPSEPYSTETGGTNQYGSFCSHLLVSTWTGHITVQGGCSCATGSHHGPPWCHVAYWELNTRVGRQFPVHESSVNVFADLPHGDGMCLGALVKTNATKQESILRTREKIGAGVTITREDDSVWVYNRSKVPLFVNSPTLDAPGVSNLTVFKVPPGYSIKLFDYAISRAYRALERRGPREHNSDCLRDGPFDPNSVRISFAKGWGPKYSRQFVTSCPCVLEVLLTPPPPR